MLAEVVAKPGSTAAELSGALHLHAGTVRNYLHALELDGKVEERPDEARPSPRGTTGRWFPLDPPIGVVAEPTDELLCDACAVKQFHSLRRYQAALSDDAVTRTVELGDRLPRNQRARTVRRVRRPPIPDYGAD